MRRENAALWLAQTLAETTKELRQGTMVETTKGLL
jgi:2-keto-4-pentenoate hydratase